MKLATYARNEGPPRVGIVDAAGESLVDVGEILGSGAPTTMLDLLAAGPELLERLRGASTDAAARDSLSVGDVTLLAPIPRPRKNVFCVGWNYLEHFEEGERIRQSGQELPAHPVLFSKVPTSVTGPYDPIPFDPRVSEKIDWEVELALVIGVGGKNISEERAWDHIFGYTVANDVSARDLQRQHGGQWLKGKSLDGHCPMGPWIVTPDEIDPNNVRVTSRVNGQTKQDSNTRHLYFKIPRLLRELSLGITLEPGDILLTGTPEGVGYARTPPEFLKPGDLLETEIEGIGTLRNRVQHVAD